MSDQPDLHDGTVTLRPHSGGDAFAVLADGDEVGTLSLRRVDEHTGDLTWSVETEHRGQGLATRAVRLLVDYALTESGQGGLGYSRVEARVAEGNEAAMRVATRSGLRREGVRRSRTDTPSSVVLARLSDDPPLSEPGAFRALLNSFLPRKRAIAQMLVRDRDGRVLMCGLTYKQDWDLPGGVVEVGESPQVAVAREVTEELALDLPAGPLVLTDWLPPWSGWDDALCLVFDGGVHDAALLDTVVRQEREIREVAFCTVEEVRERATDFTARRVEAALANLTGPGGPAYAESGRVS